MEDSLRDIAADVEDLQLDIQRAAGLSLVLWLAMSHENSVLDFDRYKMTVDVLSDKIVDVERAYEDILHRLNDITDKLEPRKKKIAPVTDQSTQGA